jgi:hypothetical protein
MAEETPKKETPAEKLKRLKIESEIARLEAEAAKRAKPSVKETVKETASVVKEKAAKGLGKAREAVVNAAGFGKKTVVNPITGRVEKPPSLLEKGINSLADAATALKTKVQIATTSNVDERLKLSMTPAQQSKKALEDANRAKTYKQTIEAQARDQRLSAPSKNLDVGPDKKVVVSKRGVQAVVPKDMPSIAVREPLDARVNSYRAKLENFLGRESPMLNNPSSGTARQGAILGAKNKVQKMAGSGFAKDFLIAGLNKSGMFTADEVPAVAQQLLTDENVVNQLNNSMLFDGLEPPKTVQKGQVKLPKPADAGSKIQTIVDDYGNEVRVTPEGRVRNAAPPEQPTLQERLARFQIGKQREAADRLEAARKLLAPYGDPDRDARLASEAAKGLSPYGGKGPSVSTGPQAQAALRHEIETKARALAAQRAEAAAAREAARTRITEANNASEKAFLERLAKQREADELARISEVWDLRTPAEIASASAIQNAGPNPSGVTRMDRLRQIAIENKKGVSPLDVKLAKTVGTPNTKIWGDRVTSNAGATYGRNPSTTFIGSAKPFLPTMSAVRPTISGLAGAGRAVGGVGMALLTPLQIYDQINDSRSSDQMIANYRGSDPLSLRALIDLGLDSTGIGGGNAKQALTRYNNLVNDPRYIEMNPISSMVGQAARGNTEYLKSFFNNLAYYGDGGGWFE